MLWTCRKAQTMLMNEWMNELEGLRTQRSSYLIENILIIKPTICTNFSIFFGINTLQVSDSSSVHHQEFFTVHTTMIHVIQVCWQLASRIRTERPDPARKLSTKPVWRIPLLCVQWKTPGDGQRNCPKHVDCYSKNKFEKLVHLVGFIKRIYHDARSPEPQTHREHCNH